MTTNYHTAIAVGAAANASTFNSPMSTIDTQLSSVTSEVTTARAAYANLNARLDSLIASGGNVASLTDGVASSLQRSVTLDSTTGFIAGARVGYTLSGLGIEYNTIDTIDSATDLTLTTNIGTGGIADNTYFFMISESEYQAATTMNSGNSQSQTLPNTIGWLERGIFFAEAYGFSPAHSAADNTTALEAVAAAAAGGTGGIVVLPVGLCAINNFTFDEDSVLLVGAGMPKYTGATLFGGTILTGGTISFSGQRSGLLDLGIIVSGKNAISSGAASGLRTEYHIQNVAAVGNGTNHGCVFATGRYNLVRNFRAYKFQHGLVFKDSHNMASDIYAEECTISCLTLKSDAGTDCYYNYINGIKSTAIVKGDAGGIWLQAAGGTNHVSFNNVSNINLFNSGAGVIFINDSSVAGQVQYNIVSDGIIDTTDFQGVVFDDSNTSAGNGPDNNSVANLLVTNADTFSFANVYGGSNNAIVGCRSISPGSGHGSGVFVQYGINGQSNRILQVSANATQTLSNNTLTDITWNIDNYDPYDMHDTGANQEVITGIPFSGALVLIHVQVQFTHNTTGDRIVVLQRDIGGGYATFAYASGKAGGTPNYPEVVDLFYVTNFASTWNFKIKALQDSGGNLDTLAASWLTVEMIQ